MAEIEVRGIREVSAAFRKVDKELGRALRAEFLLLAGRVASATRSKVPADSGKARASVKPRASQRGASIAVGGAAAPYYPWLDFGGTTGKGHRPGVPWSGSVIGTCRSAGATCTPRSVRAASASRRPARMRSSTWHD